MRSERGGGRERPVGWLALLGAFAEVGCTSLGGWLAYYHDAFVVRRRWLSDPEFLEGSALSNLVPGPIFVNFTVFAAQRLGGWGAVPVALALSLVPGAAAMLLLSHWYAGSLGQSAVAQAGLRGIGAAAAAFTAITVLRVLRSHRPGLPMLGVAALTLLALGPLHFALVPTVPALALLALWLNRPVPEAPA